MTKQFLNIPKNKKGIFLILIGLLIGLMLIISDNTKAPTQETQKELDEINEYKNDLEVNLEHIIKSISGIDNVDVLITIESGSEYVYASDDADTSEKHVIVDNSLVVVKKNLPIIKGVAVVCSGGNKTETKVKITELLCSVLDLSTTRIYVTE